MCGIYCVYKQSRSCQLPFCASPIFHFEIEVYCIYRLCLVLQRACSWLVLLQDKLQAIVNRF